MNKRMMALCGMVVALGAGTVYGVQAQNPVVTPANPVKMGRRERHPEIMKAIRALENGKKAMLAGAKDFGGHKEKAIDLTNQALAELRLALKSDRN